MHVPRWTPLVCVAIALQSAVGWADSKPDVFFSKQVEPILVARCLKCHGSARKGDLDLRTKTTALKGGESGAVIVPGKPDDSLLYEYVSSGEMPPKKQLPADEIKVLKQWIAEGAFFPARKLNLFSLSTDHRAGYDWWSLQPIRKPQPPQVRNPQRARTPIDRFVMARLETAGLVLSPPATRAAYLRRVSDDLTGLRPSFAEVRRFVNDARPDAFERVIDRLLASPHYGERWGRHWLDVARFAESNGFERDRIRTDFWRYRDYVIRAFNADKPFDQFVREQLAGDALDANDPAHLIATGFLVAGPKNDVSTVSELERLQTRQDELDEYVSATGTTFLGLTVGCARCHEHKFDPISMHDYYGLTAVFSGLDRANNVVALPAERQRHAAAVAEVNQRIKEFQSRINRLLEPARKRLLAQRKKVQPKGLLAMVNPRENVETFPAVDAKFVRFDVVATTANSQPCLDELEIYGEDATRNLALAARGAKATASSLLPGYRIHQIHHLNDGKLGNAHSWISNQRGQGWAQIELAGVATIRRIIWGRDREQKYKDRLAVDYRIQISLDGETWKTVSGSSRHVPFNKDPQATVSDKDAVKALTPTNRAHYNRLHLELTGAESVLKRLPPLPVSYSARDGQPQPAFVLRRGNVRSRGETVGPAALSAVSKLSPSLLPAKNDSGPNRRLRLAEWIVDPDNPLTSRVFVNRIWHYHFGQGLVNTPNDFGFSGDRPSHPQLLDWLAADFMQHGWRIKRLHRLIVLSETYRQGTGTNPRAVQMDGSNRLLWRMTPRRLDSHSLRDAILQISGQLDFALGGPSYRLFRYRDGNVPDYILLDEPGEETKRRAVYMFNIRTFQSPLMSAFDCPDPSVQTPKRNSSVTALQALSLMNNRFVFDQANSFAARVAKSAGSDADRQAVHAYRIALSRNPTDDQRRRAAEFIGKHGLFSLCRVLLNTNEFLYVY